MCSENFVWGRRWVGPRVEVGDGEEVGVHEGKWVRVWEDAPRGAHRRNGCPGLTTGERDPGRVGTALKLQPQGGVAKAIEETRSKTGATRWLRLPTRSL